MRAFSNHCKLMLLQLNTFTSWALMIPVHIIIKAQHVLIVLLVLLILWPIEYLLTGYVFTCIVSMLVLGGVGSLSFIFIIK